MTEQDEKSISRIFAGLPRQSLPGSGKEQIWARVHNYIVSVRKQDKAELKLPAWKYLFLPRTLVRIGATVMVVVLALTLTRSVARAQPGETLYPVKIAAETVEKVVAFSDTAKVKVNIKHAKRRLAEVKILVEEKKDTKIVEQTLEALKTSTDEVVEVVSVADVKPELTREASKLAAEQEQVLTNVELVAPSDVKDAVKDAIISTKETISKLAADEKDGGQIKGVANVLPGESPSDTPTSTAKTAKKPVKKIPAVKDTPVDTTTDLGEVVTVDENNEPVPLDETDNQ